MRFHERLNIHVFFFSSFFFFFFPNRFLLFLSSLSFLSVWVWRGVRIFSGVVFYGSVFEGLFGRNPMSESRILWLVQSLVPRSSCQHSYSSITSCLRTCVHILKTLKTLKNLKPFTLQTHHNRSILMTPHF